MENNADFLNYFNNLLHTYNDSSYPLRTAADELDDLWNDYNSYINELKEDGYTVLRNNQGKHRVVKN